MMKKTLLTALACVLALGLSASTASALAISDADPNYLGWVDPSVPADASGEVQSINDLLAQPSPSGPTTISGVTYLRTANDCPGGCPAAEEAGADQGQGPSASVDVTGWTYLVAKYGTAAHVWYVGDLTGAQDVPLNGFGGFHPKTGEPQINGQSHYSLYNPTTTTVPDGGATAGLLGLAMLGLGYLRRRIG